MTATQMVAALTVADVGIMVALLYISGEHVGHGTVVAGVAVVAISIILAYRMIAK